MFRIQLLSEKTIVLVEAAGYESEIFVPQLRNNRIVLTNVIYSRQPKIQASQTQLGVRSSLMRCNRVGHRRLVTATAGLSPGNASSKHSSLDPKFELKLISNGNVLLVECNGYESEIFLPLISSRCVALKRVSACELTQFAYQKSRIQEEAETLRDQKGNENVASLAASLAAQAVGLSKLLVYLPLKDKPNKERTIAVKERPKKKSRQQTKSDTNAKNSDHRKYRSIYSNTS
ncbi:uncharacterized protein LOC117787380 [Drosophila innubila]|uniref:uncharacterized protein LOC117787380 n=1 Tax=Drosophila innubila TaxID=198719 RepID=UPI00148D3934|nr:uncharacterized protein LOC117787380 [Drosophila innubila]